MYEGPFSTELKHLSKNSEILTLFIAFLWFILPWPFFFLNINFESPFHSCLYNFDTFVCRVVAVVGAVRYYGAVLLTVLTMTYMATRLAMAMAAWLSILAAVVHHPTVAEPQSHHRTPYDGSHSTNVFDYTSHQQHERNVQQRTTNVYDGDLTPSPGGFSSRCPPRCACFGDTVDCARRGLTSMPQGIPPETQRLWVFIEQIITKCNVIYLCSAHVINRICSLQD